MLLEDFNYLFNKAIYQYINKRYNIYDVNQQSTDDLRVLKSTAVLEPLNSNQYGGDDPLFGKVAEFSLPLDYMHILNCICNFKVDETFKCYNKGDNVQFSARRMTSDAWSQVLNNFYLKPMYKRPYYFIHNVNTNTELPTNPSNGWTSGTDQSNEVIKEGTIVTSGIDFKDTESGTNYGEWLTKGGQYKIYSESINGVQIDPCALIFQENQVTDSSECLYVTIKQGIIVKASLNQEEDSSKIGDVFQNNLPRTITIGKQSVSLVEKPGMNRYGNASPVRMEVRYGKDSSVFKLDRIYVDYIKTPQHIRLTQEQLDMTRDTSQIMEFPDYVCQEIINELVKLMMENAGDPRLQTHIPINQTIANPAPQQQPSK